MATKRITTAEIVQPLTNTKQKRIKVGTEEKIVLLGSCFANEIGEKLLEDNYNVCINPFGTLFNPVSIANSLERLSNGKPFTNNDVIEALYGRTEGVPIIKYGSFYHYTLFSRESPEEFLEYANKRLIEDSALFKAANRVIITLGTAWIFRHLASGIIVSNCHKKPAKEFVREFLNIKECVEILKKMLFTSSGTLKYPDKKFIFTVSPVRHLNDSAHGNQLSKATLLLAIDELQKYCERLCNPVTAALQPKESVSNNTKSSESKMGSPALKAGINRRNSPDSAINTKTGWGNTGNIQNIIGYFPAYEIMIDELRDYKYYANDLVHPNQEAIDYIYKRFKEWSK